MGLLYSHVQMREIIIDKGTENQTYGDEMKMKSSHNKILFLLWLYVPSVYARTFLCLSIFKAYLESLQNTT